MLESTRALSTRSELAAAVRAVPGRCMVRGSTDGPGPDDVGVSGWSSVTVMGDHHLDAPDAVRADGAPTGRVLTGWVLSVRMLTGRTS